ncbi:sensor domain-containing diguanylate cyclase [Sporosarcina siberiensis]|uniref:Sensor domain-containing diguanylate cyclase n=1 Tax=Sporosarcina siberiensis TaxID=1365606 RepID=A0ABW4SKD4_9BACL
MKFSLKHLILLVALLSVALTLISSITSGHRVNQDTLIENTLETNRVYAQKLADVTDTFFKTTLQTLKYSSKDVVEYMKQNNSEELLLKETKRLFNETNTFNSVVVTSATGKIIAASPEKLDLLGKQVTSPGGLQALEERKPLITKPYTSITNRLIIFISHPIFDDKGQYLGYVGGSIYLLEENILNDLLGKHFYQDGSYVYVVNEDGKILYHPEKSRISAIVPGNPVIEAVISGKSGDKRLTNSKGMDLLAGYAYMPTTSWGVVSQRPTEMALLPATETRNEMIINTLPFLLLSFIIIIYISNQIAKPLEKLGKYAESSMIKNEKEEIVDVNAWYYEAIQLEKALVKSLSFLEDKVNYFIHESTIDPLTGLVNRRSMDETTKKWIDQKVPFSIILFDIDRFKRVNDTYGHSVGDEVLKFVAKEMLAVSRSTDVCCRYGGEEFIMLLPQTTILQAFDIAERLRMKFETTVSPCGEVITISSGVASYPECAEHIMTLIEVADKSLYEAKNSGRNKTIMADFTEAHKELLKS